MKIDKIVFLLQINLHVIVVSSMARPNANEQNEPKKLHRNFTKKLHHLE